MALLKCIKCAEPYSDSLNICPHCGFTPQAFLCPECGGIHGLSDTACPNCGYQLTARGAIADQAALSAALEKVIAALPGTKTVRQAEKNLYLLSLLAQEEGAAPALEQAQQLLQTLRRQEEQSRLYAWLTSAQPETEQQLAETIGVAESLGEYENAPQIAADLKERLADLRYNAAHSKMTQAKTAADWLAAGEAFAALGEYRDAPQKAADCQGKHDAMTAKAKKKTAGIVIGIVAAVLVIAIAASSILFFIPNHHYNSGLALYESGSYGQAAEAFDKAGNFKDAPVLAVEARKAQAYTDGDAAFAAGDFLGAREFYLAAEDYPNAAARADECVLADHHAQGCKLLEEGKFQDAIDQFALAKGYSDSDEKTLDSWYGMADACQQAGDLVKAAELFGSVHAHKDAGQRAEFIAHQLLDSKQYTKAAQAFDALPDGAAYAAYCRGLEAYSKKDYANAGVAFKDAGKTENASELFTESVYLQGLELLAKKDFEAAQVCFDTVREYKDAANLNTVCLAEVALADGWMWAALELYKKVPAELTVEGFDIPGRIAQVNSVSRFANICGKWTVTKNYIESRCQYRFGSRWWNWYHDSPLSGQTMTVTCFLNDDGTVKMKCEVTFYRFTSYDYYGNCYATTTTKTFTKDNLKTIPTSITVDNSTTVTWSNNSFRLKYSVRDEGNADFYYMYNSDVTYGQRSAIY